MIPMLRHDIYLICLLICLPIILSKYPYILQSLFFSVDVDTSWQNHEFCCGCLRAYRSKLPDWTRSILGSPLLVSVKTRLGLCHSLLRA